MADETPRYYCISGAGMYRDDKPIGPWQMLCDVANMLDKLTRFMGPAAALVDLERRRLQQAITTSEQQAAEYRARAADPSLNTPAWAMYRDDVIKDATQRAAECDATAARLRAELAALTAEPTKDPSDG